MMENLHTSTVELISSIHGHQRRVERAIAKRDLQAAVKYGQKEMQTKVLDDGTVRIRYKYSFADIVYITDESSTHEVTSWVVPMPLDLFATTTHDTDQYNTAKNRIAEDPNSITSHSILVIDHSGSMKKADVEGHRCRAAAVSYSIATEFIAKRLHNPSAVVTPLDVVTVIEMRDAAKIVFEKEPMSWVLYNKIVERSKVSRPSSHGNYLPSLDLALDIFLENDHKNLQLILFFLSDGRPSDKRTSNDNINEHHIYEKTRHIGNQFGKRLTFGMVGFSGPREDFKILKNMASSLELAGATGKFHRSDLKQVDSLSSSLATLSASLSNTRTLVSKLHPGDKREEKIMYYTLFQEKHQDRPDSSWEIRTVAKDKLECYELVRAGKKYIWKKISLLHPNAYGAAFKTKPFANGAERVVYQSCEIDKFGQFVGDKLVAKEDKYVTDYQGDFHFKFCKTQKVAESLANEFNRRLDMSCCVESKVPRIKFLECFVYRFRNEYGNLVDYLVEKQIDPKQYTKWNDNTGGVRGQMKEDMPVDDELDLVTKQFKKLDIIQEEDEEEDDDEDRDEDGTAPQSLSENQTSKEKIAIIDCEVPQAFSHFTNKWTKRFKIVVDLQGVLNTSGDVAAFELTDPAIHFDSPNGNRCVFGRTDRGRKGIQEFFKTHKCNNLCKALGF